MKKRSIIRIILTVLKVLVALAAAANLVALFVYRYQIPPWLSGARSVVVQPTSAPVSSVFSEDTARLNIPVVPVNYSGEADMDELVMDGVYLMGTDGQPIDNADIRYEILPGDSSQSKILRYSVTLDSGETVTQDRTMNLTARYTGPTITLLGVLPDIDPAEADDYMAALEEKGILRADDGFGNDAFENVTAVFTGLSDENPDADLTLTLENQVHDTIEMQLNVSVANYTGVVLTLTDYQLTLKQGDAFEPLDYVSYAHDAEGNDLMESVTVDSDVNTEEPGDYEVWYWAMDSEETYSPIKKLYVTVEPAPEDAADTEETEETP